MVHILIYVIYATYIHKKAANLLRIGGCNIMWLMVMFV